MLHSVIQLVNSDNRLSGDHSDFTYEIKLPSKRFDRICILSASIPKSYYLVQNGFNTFQVDEAKNSRTITIPAGNYSASSFAYVLGNLLTSTSTAGLTYTVTPPSSVRTNNLGKFTYTINPVQPVSFILGTNLHEQLGFDSNSTNAFVGPTLESKNCINMQLEDTIFIHSDACSNGTSSDSVLQEIFCSNTPDYGKIEFLNPHPPSYSRVLSTKSSNIYSFSITNESGEKLDLNGRNVVFTVMFWKEDTIQRDYTKLLLEQLAQKV